jgi:hypothetical protein
MCASPRLLSWLSLPGALVMIWGLWALWWEGAVFGMILALLPKLWFIDRMVWVHRDWVNAGRAVPGYDDRRESGMAETIEITVDERGVARLTLNRPDKHNAMNAAMIAELTEAAGRLGRDPAVRVVVLTGRRRVVLGGRGSGLDARADGGRRRDPCAGGAVALRRCWARSTRCPSR